MTNRHAGRVLPLLCLLCFIIPVSPDQSGQRISGRHHACLMQEPSHAVAFVQAAIHVKKHIDVDETCSLCFGRGSTSSSPGDAVRVGLISMMRAVTSTDIRQLLLCWSLASIGMGSLVLGLFKWSLWKQTPASSSNSAPKKRSAYTWPLIWARLVTTVTSMAEGYGAGCLSGAHLMFDRDLNLSASQSAFVMSVAQFAMAVGAPFGAVLADRWGRLTALALCYVTMVVGALLMGFAASFPALCIGRIMEAIGMGSSMCVVTTYMTEVSPSDIRGQLPSLEEPLINLGFLLSYVVNWVFAGAANGWRWMLGLGCVLPGLMLWPLLLGLPPESPRFLLSQGERGKAERELATLVDDEEAEEMLSAWTSEPESHIVPWSQVLWPDDPAAWRSLVAGVGVMSLQMLSGNSVVVVYPTTIFAEEMGVNAANLFSVLMSISRLLTTVPILFMIDTVGRRRLLLCSLGGMTLACILIGVFFSAGTSALPWKVCTFLLFSVFYCVGAGPVAWVYTGEVMDTSVRSKGMSLAVVIARVYGGCLLLAYPSISSRIGIGSFFMILAVFNFVGWSFIMLSVPETKGTPLEEMRNHFKCSQH
mmetsp:Transcript_32007/g.91880  ORF Transcript_32007/g.91880 Transcript_32007/m.91880 type:complete len:589 (+) Transcript_32007:76-1842(+)